MCQSSTENKKRYESMKNKSKKAFSKEMSKKVEEVLIELKNYLNVMFGLLRVLKIHSEEVGGKCIRGNG